jgi:hypothetical protein
LDLTLEAEENPEKPLITVLTNTGEVREYQVWGKIHFEVSGEAVELTLLYSSENDTYFLLFMDATNGEESYSGGRYIDPERLPDGRFHIDFNCAYSPYCAYNDRWSCPIPPKENRLTVRIEAGEKAFQSASY